MDSTQFLVSLLEKSPFMGVVVFFFIHSKEMQKQLIELIKENNKVVSENTSTMREYINLTRR